MKNYSYAERIELVHSGNNYFEVLKGLISEARVSFHLQTYIFEFDETGKSIIVSLMEAGRRGVEVFVLADAFGSNGLPSTAVKKMQAAGIKFRFFSPLFSKEGISFGRRLHHKIAVADGKRALIGGINIADKYKGEGAVDPWLDYAVLVEGSLCTQLQALCRRIYDRKRRLSLYKKEKPITPTQAENRVRFRRNDWLLGINEVHKSYLEAVIGADKSIILVASYFLPGRLFRKLLREASQRGVEIKIILAGKSDAAIIYQAENYLYDFYLRNGIQVYQWKNSVMHGKAMSVDGSWTTIGSYNLNYLSHYLSIELNVDIKDKTFAENFNRDIYSGILNKSVKIESAGDHRNISLLRRVLMRASYAVYRILQSFMMTRRKQNPEKISKTRKR